MYDDPLDEEEQLQLMLAQLPSICRFEYSKTGKILEVRLDNFLNQYKKICDMIDTTQQSGVAPPAQLQLQTKICESQLAWLCYIVGAIVQGHATCSSSSREGDEKTDAILCRRVLILMQMVDERLTTGKQRVCVHLELALLYFFSCFRTAYIGEQQGMPSQSRYDDVPDLFWISTHFFGYQQARPLI